jgi:hypothetical protein
MHRHESSIAHAAKTIRTTSKAKQSNSTAAAQPKHRLFHSGLGLVVVMKCTRALQRLAQAGAQRWVAEHADVQQALAGG